MTSIPKSINKIWDRWLLQLWGLIVHTRDRGCQWCNKQDGDGKMDAHHIFGRKKKSVRWYTPNGIKLCYYCHKYRKDEDPEGLRSRIIIKMGLGAYRALCKKAIAPLPFIDYFAWERSLLQEAELLKVTIPQRPKKLPQEGED